MPPDLTLTPVGDTWLNAQQPTTNYSSAAEMIMGGNALGIGFSGFDRHLLLDFDITTVAHDAISAVLSITLTTDYGGVDNGEHPHLKAHRVLRDDTVISQATYNVYKTGSNWASGGGSTVGTDVSIANAVGDDIQNPTPGTVYTVDVYELLNDARAATPDRFLILNSPSQITASLNAIGFATTNHATVAWWPKLEIYYGCVPVHPEPLFIPHKDQLRALANDFTDIGIARAQDQQAQNFKVIEQWAHDWIDLTGRGDRCRLFIPHKEHSREPWRISSAQSFDNWKAIERWAFSIYAGECGCNCDGATPPPDGCFLYIPHKDALASTTDPTNLPLLRLIADWEFDNLKALERWANLYAAGTCGCT